MCIAFGDVLAYFIHQPLCFIDMLDLAELVAKVLVEADHKYANYEISSSQHLSGLGLATELSSYAKS